MSNKRSDFSKATQLEVAQVGLKCTGSDSKACAPGIELRGSPSQLLSTVVCAGPRGAGATMVSKLHQNPVS